MTTFREWFNVFTDATGETVETVCLGWEHSWGEYHKDGWPGFPEAQKMPFTDLPDEVLDHEFSDGYGGNDSPNLCAWSESYVIFSDNYDGSESICWVPRHPTDHQPARPGGG